MTNSTVCRMYTTGTRRLAWSCLLRVRSGHVSVVKDTLHQTCNTPPLSVSTSRFANISPDLQLYDTPYTRVWTCCIAVLSCLVCTDSQYSIAKSWLLKASLVERQRGIDYLSSGGVPFSVQTQKRISTPFRMDLVLLDQAHKRQIKSKKSFSCCFF